MQLYSDNGCGADHCPPGAESGEGRSVRLAADCLLYLDERRELHVACPGALPYREVRRRTGEGGGVGRTKTGHALTERNVILWLDKLLRFREVIRFFLFKCHRGVQIFCKLFLLIMAHFCWWTC